MASKTLIILLIINFIITAHTQEQNTSAEIKNTEETEEIEDTTLPTEEDYRTTTVSIERDEEVRDQNEEGKEGEDLAKNEPRIEVEVDDSVENNTDDTTMDVTVSTLNNDVDITVNITNSNEVFTKTETIPQTTTKSMDEESAPRIPDSKEDTDTPGPRIPKADNDYTPPEPLPQPQSTRSIVRGWLEDPWIRSPIGILVPLRAEALSKALAVWTDLNVSTLNLSKVCFMAYDENGVSWRSKHSLHPTSYNSHEKTVTEALSKLLMKYQGVNTELRTDGTMRALIGAAKLVPYDSALFVFTDEEAGDIHRLPLAVRAVVEKRLKVYTLWTDHTYPSADNEGLEALRNISRHTEGEVISYPLQVMDLDGNLPNEAELELWNPLDLRPGRRGKLNHDVDVQKFDLLVVRRGGGQAISLGVPVENGVSALRIFIEGAVEHAVLYPPNDAPQIDLYNTTSVSSFSPSSKTEGISPRDVYLIFPGNQYDSDVLSVLPALQTRPDQDAFVGMWHLSVRCDTCDYRLCVSARANIHFEVTPDTPTGSVKFRVTGPVASVRESQLVDEYGTELAKLPFSYQPLAGDGQNAAIDPMVELVADVALPAVKDSKIYAKIVGRDIRGEPFVRLTGPLIQPEVRMGRSAHIAFPESMNDLERIEEFNTGVANQFQRNESAPLLSRVSQIVNQQGTLLTTVQIGLASRLYGSPGDNLQLHFEVTNYREQSVRFAFGATGEMRFLTGINPTSQTVVSGQTVNVIVSLLIPSNTQAGIRDTITFTAYGPEQISMQAYVYAVNQGDVIDNWPPEVRHSFQGTCIGRTGEDCAQHTWSATITARDPISGLLRLSSTPIGLLYNGEFISGSRQEVVATYRATCCAPRVLIHAVDGRGNAESFIVDISGYLNGASIAAIVLGVFLIIALIVLLVLLIYWCVKKRRESRELPSFNNRT